MPRPTAICRVIRTSPVSWTATWNRSPRSKPRCRSCGCQPERRHRERLDATCQEVADAGADARNSMPTMWPAISGKKVTTSNSATSRCSRNCASGRDPDQYETVTVLQLDRQHGEAGGRRCPAGVSLFNRFYQPDIDVDGCGSNTPSRRPNLWMPCCDALGGDNAWTHRSVRWGRRAASTAADAIKLLLAGTDVVHLCHALLQQGPDLLGRMRSELEAWMEQQGFEQLGDFRGRMSQISVLDPRTTSASTTSACRQLQWRRQGVALIGVCLRPADSCVMPRAALPRLSSAGRRTRASTSTITLSSSASMTRRTLIAIVNASGTGVRTAWCNSRAVERRARARTAASSTWHGLSVCSRCRHLQRCLSRKAAWVRAYAGTDSQFPALTGGRPHVHLWSGTQPGRGFPGRRRDTLHRPDWRHDEAPAVRTLAGYRLCGVFCRDGGRPVSRTVWVAEIIPVVLVFLGSVHLPALPLPATPPMR